MFSRLVTYLDGEVTPNDFCWLGRTILSGAWSLADGMPWVCNTAGFEMHDLMLAGAVPNIAGDHSIKRKDLVTVPRRTVSVALDPVSGVYALREQKG